MSMVLKDDTIIPSRFKNQSRKGSVIQWHPRNARFLVSHPFYLARLLMVTIPETGRVCLSAKVAVEQITRELASVPLYTPVTEGWWPHKGRA